MQIKTFLFSLSICITLGTSTLFAASQTSNITNEIRWVSPELAVSRVDDTLTLGGERIYKNSDRLDQWLSYAQNQLQQSPNNAGYDHFIGVIQDYKNGKINDSNELYILFGTNTKIDAPIDFATQQDAIEIFCTAITAPEAILTSHMGIARSLASLKRQNKKRALPTSIYLHSFGAKILASKSTKKQFMLTTPVLGMLNIIKAYTKLSQMNALFEDYSSTNALPVVEKGLATIHPEETSKLNQQEFSQIHQWLETASYQPVLPNPEKPGAERPYMLIHIPTLAGATTLQAD